MLLASEEEEDDDEEGDGDEEEDEDEERLGEGTRESVLMSISKNPTTLTTSRRPELSVLNVTISECFV